MIKSNALDVNSAIRELDRYQELLSDIKIDDDLYAKHFFELVEYTHHVKCELNEQWKDFCTQAIKTKLANLLFESPFISRSYFKPNGYAGDAVMLDYIYQMNDISTTSELGKKLLRCSQYSKSFTAVRERAQIFSQKIDDAAKMAGDLEVFSIACGHARELLYNNAFKNNQIKRFAALDQDYKSIECVNQSYLNHPSISTIIMNIKRLIIQPIPSDFGSFDLIYASGLFDYLPDKTALLLMNRMLELLKPGGKMYLSNFLTDLEESAFMDCFLDWHLIYRSMGLLEDLANSLDPKKISSYRSFTDSLNYIGYVEIVKT